MGLSPIKPIIQPATIETMLNNTRPNIGDGLNFVTGEKSFNPYPNHGAHLFL